MRMSEAQPLAQQAFDDYVRASAAIGNHPRTGRRWPAMARQIQALRDRMRFGFTDVCPHLEPVEPAPAYWIAAEPETIHCVQCAPDALAAYAIPALQFVMSDGAEGYLGAVCVHCEERRLDTELVVALVGCVIAAVHLCEDCLDTPPAAA
jgi:hypothetical protein